mmetsp:Transcript_23583/g.49117  ORF Transcript_23583/g.49117 Transcript_23583/m.49117 type:complete len:275 (+) Transcript_23583:27-851(+)
MHATTAFLFSLITYSVTFMTHSFHLGQHSVPAHVHSRSLLLSSTKTSSPPTASTSSPHFFDYLQFDGKPTFDVMEKTKEYVAKRGNAQEEMYAKDYVLRGGVIGPLTRKDLVETQAGFDLLEAFSEVETNPFGYAIDPRNPYRCFFFEQWTAKHTGTLKAGPTTLPATGNSMDGPVSVTSIHWNPKGEIVYESVGNVVDRHEGNTAGKAAVFGLLHTAGLKLPGAPGSLALRIQQRLGHFLGQGGRSFSREDDIPRWWKSKSRGADVTDDQWSN